MVLNCQINQRYPNPGLIFLDSKSQTLELVNQNKKEREEKRFNVRNEVYVNNLWMVTAAVNGNFSQVYKNPKTML